MSDLGPAGHLFEHAATVPNRIAVHTDRGRLTYGDLAAEVESRAAEFRNHGVGPGTVVAFYAAADVEGISSVLAVDHLGSTARPAPAHQDMAITEIDSSALVHLATSGSSGSPRFVPLTRDNVAASIGASQARLGNTADDTWLLCLPLHHVAGLSVLWRSLAAGGSVAVHPSFDASRVVAALAGPVTIGSMVPTMLRRTLDSGTRFDSVRWMLVGGAASATNLLAESLRAGIPGLATYGTTESASQVATVSPEDIEAGVGTTGAPLDGMEVSITDIGEILVDGPAVFHGYVGEEPRTGPHNTRDLGSIDAHGRLVVHGRLDEMINTGGEKAYPTMIEAVLETHPEVSAAFVYGVPDGRWGSRVEAIVESTTVAPDDIIAWSKARLDAHEVPKRVNVVSRLARLASGKVDRARADRRAP